MMALNSPSLNTGCLAREIHRLDLRDQVGRLHIAAHADALRSHRLGRRRRRRRGRRYTTDNAAQQPPTEPPVMPPPRPPTTPTPVEGGGSSSSLICAISFGIVFGAINLPASNCRGITFTTLGALRGRGGGGGGGGGGATRKLCKWPRKDVEVDHGQNHEDADHKQLDQGRYQDIQPCWSSRLYECLFNMRHFLYCFQRRPFQRTAKMSSGRLKYLAYVQIPAALPHRLAAFFAARPAGAP